MRFYAAFGTKAGLHARIIDRWADTGAVPLAALLRIDQPVADVLSAMLEQAARRYAADVLLLPTEAGACWRISTFGNAGDHLDLEIEPGEPVDPNSRPVRVRGLCEHLALDGHDRGEL